MIEIDKLLEKKINALSPNSIWTFAKQETQFENVFKAACIFSTIVHPENENIENYFNTHDYKGFTCNHRMLSSAQLFGLITKTANRYDKETVTPVFKELEKYGIGSPEFNTIKTEQLLKIKMSAIIDRSDNAKAHHIFPVFYIFDVLYSLYKQGIDSISMGQLFSYVMTCESSAELEDTVALLLTNPKPCKYVEQYKSNCRMWTLIEKNCNLFVVKGNRVSINKNYIEFFYNHFYMNNKNVVESILDSIVEFPEAYKRALSTYQNLDIDITDDVPIVNVRFKRNELSEFKNSVQKIYYGAPGTGKSHEIKELTKGESVVRTTFHPDSDYSTFVGAYKPTMDDVDVKAVPVVLGESGTVFNKNEGTYKEPRIVYRFVMQAFLKAYLGAWKKYADATNDEVEPQFLVIEEINRGNCAQIFGDLFQLLDRNENRFSEYPIEADTDLQQEIERAFKEHKDYKLEEGVKINAEGAVKDYKSNYDATLSEDIQAGRILLLPPNLCIWATMNTSDQSLFPIDSAFKRRWDWKYMKIKDEGKDWKIDVELNVKDADGNPTTKKLGWWPFIEKINDIIASMTSSADKQLGYFFCKATENEEGKSEPTIITKDTFVSKVIFYLWNDVFKDYGFEDASLFQYKETIDGNEETRDLTFPDFYDKDGEHVNTERLKGFLESVMNWQKNKEEQR